MTARASGYDAFISYSHALDGKLAPTLQRELERFAKPWYRMRALRVFRDTTSLAANPGLWSSIEQALAASEWLVLMASPEAARSPWVDREVSWWLANRSPQRLLVVVTGGGFGWDERTRDLDPTASTAAPPALYGAFSEEPRWVDLRWLRGSDQVDRSNPRLRESVADIAAAVRGVPKDLLVGEHIRQHRRTMRLARGAISTLVVLLVLALAATGVAVVQRNEAREQARIATARQLAATAVANVGTQLDLAQLLAVEAYRLDPGPQTRAALFQAVAASPHLVQYRPIGAAVTALAGSADGRTAVAGTSTGRLVRWDLRRNESSEVAVGARRILDVAVTADGRKVVATDGVTTVLWNAGAGNRPTTLRTGPAQLVAISPAGRLLATLAWAGGERYSPDPSTVTLLDGRTGAELRHTSTDASGDRLGLPDESTLVLAGGAGTWQRLATGGLRETARSDELITPAGDYVAGFSADGGYVGYVKYGAVTVRATTAERDVPDGSGPPEIPVPEPEQLAISQDGTRAAVAGGGAFSVADLRGNGAEALRQLSGTGRTEAVAFVGDGQRLVSAAGGALSLWNLGQLSRLNAGPTVDVPETSNVGPPPGVAVAPDGKRVAVVAGDGTEVDVHDLSGRTPRSAKRHLGDRADVPLWSADGSRLLLVGAGGAALLMADGRAVGRWPGAGSEPVLAGGASPDGQRVVLVDYRGGVQVRRASDGRMRRSVPGQSTEPPPGSLRAGTAAVSADARTAAFIRPAESPAKRTVVVVDTGTGRAHQLPGDSAEVVSFGEDRLLVQRDDGTLEVWNTTGTRRLRSFPGDAGYARAISAVPGTGLVARLRGDGTALIVDLRSGDVLGSIQLPPMTRGSVASPWHATTMAATPDGVLLSATSGGALARWQLDEDTWQRVACATAGRDLTPAEWRDTAGTDPPEKLACRR